MSKEIYKFSVNKKTKVNESKIETYTDENNEVKNRTITEEVEKEVPIEILIKKPNRKQIQEAEMVFSVEMSKCIKAGILTKAMLLNKYSDNGGIFSEKENKELTELYAELNKLQLEIVNLNLVPENERSDDQKRDLEKSQSQMTKVRKDIIDRETSYLSFFNHTADTKAQNKTILWYVLNLSFYKDPSQNHKDFVPIFQGKTFEEKENSLVEMEENEDELYNLIYIKLANLINYWYFVGKIDEEEFAKITGDENAQ